MNINNKNLKIIFTKIYIKMNNKLYKINNNNQGKYKNINKRMNKNKRILNIKKFNKTKNKIYKIKNSKNKNMNSNIYQNRFKKI